MVFKKRSISKAGNEQNVNEPNIPYTENCMFALNLNMERREEHVIIGEFENVQRFLLGYNADLLVNEKRPFGTLIDELSEVTDNLNFLSARNELSLYPFNTYRHEVNESLIFLHESTASTNLAKKFVAIRIYQEFYKAKKNTSYVNRRSINLYDIIQMIS